VYVSFSRPFVLNHSATGACRFRNRFSETTALRFFNCASLYGVHWVGTFQRQNRFCRHICAGGRSRWQPVCGRGRRLRRRELLFRSTASLNTQPATLNSLPARHLSRVTIFSARLLSFLAHFVRRFRCSIFRPIADRARPAKDRHLRFVNGNGDRGLERTNVKCLDATPFPIY
jgi:hypothetical protein